MSFSVSRTFRKYMPYENRVPASQPSLQTETDLEEQKSSPSVINPALPQQAMNPGTTNRGQVGNRLSTNSRNVSDMY
jgi:hypothetical protein